MFRHSIDDKMYITDDKGNQIVDLTDSMFSSDANSVINYARAVVTSEYRMRPDLVSFYEYDTDDYTEYILKFSGVSNPFSFDKDDILMIPNPEGVNGMLAVNTDTAEDGNQTTKDILIRNYYKFSNNSYKNDTTSYDRLLNTEIPSGNVDTTSLTAGTTPYINAGTGAGVTVRNGKIYFGENTGLDSAAMINKSLSTTDSINDVIRNVINNTVSELSDNCLYNGTSLSTFVRANMASSSN